MNVTTHVYITFLVLQLRVLILRLLYVPLEVLVMQSLVSKALHALCTLLLHFIIIVGMHVRQAGFYTGDSGLSGLYVIFDFSSLARLSCFQ